MGIRPPTGVGDAGDDLMIWDPGDGWDLIAGGAGSDRLLFNGSNGDEIFTATAVSKFTGMIFTRNLGNIVMDVRSTETLDVEARGGADTVTINDQTVYAVRTVNVDLEVGDRLECAGRQGRRSDGDRDALRRRDHRGRGRRAGRSRSRGSRRR